MSRRGGYRLDMRPVMEHYGLHTLEDKGGWFAVKCPFHDDAHASARLTLEDGGAFHCHGCGASGDALSLIVDRGDAVDIAGAIRFYEEITGDSLPDVRKGSVRKSRRELFGGARDYERGSDILSLGLRRKPRGGA